MDAKTNIKSRLPTRQLAEGPEHASRGALPLTVGPARAPEIFKKTPYGTGLQRVSRDLAKDILEFANIPLLNTALLDHSQLQGDCLVAAGHTIAESLKTVKRNSDQDVMRSANKSITFDGDVVGSNGNPASGIFISADASTVGCEAGAGAPNVKLTDKELAVHPTKGQRRATNHTSGTLWTYARQVGSAIDDAVTQPNRAHEKYCHADI
jgi:hypothetical protein